MILALTFLFHYSDADAMWIALKISSHGTASRKLMRLSGYKLLVLMLI